MSTAINHRNRSHRSYYIRKSATSGHARVTWVKTQDPLKLFKPFKWIHERGRAKEAHDAADT